MKRLRDEKGQSMVEFALVLPVLVAVVFGIIDFGWLFFNKLSVENGAREGARYAAVQAAEQTPDAMKPMVMQKVKANVSVALADDDVEITQEVTDIDGDGTPEAKYVTVKVMADVPVLTPIVGVFFPNNTCHMTSSVKMHIEQIIV